MTKTITSLLETKQWRTIFLVAFMLTRVPHNLGMEAIFVIISECLQMLIPTAIVSK